MSTMQEVLVSTKNDLGAAKLAQTLAMIEHESALQARLSAPVELAFEDVAKLAFSANLTAGLSVDVLNQDEAQALQLTTPAGSAVLTLAVFGKLSSSLKAGATLNPVFQLGANAQADAEIRATSLFYQAQSKTLGQAIIDCAPAASLPFTLAHAFHLAEQPQWQQSRIEADGKLQAGVNLTGGLQATGKTWTVNGDNSLPVGGNFGLNAYVKVQLAGLFHLAVMRDSGGIRLRLQRERKRSRDYGIKLGAEADFSVVVKDVAGLVSASLPNPEKYQEKLLALLEPGQALLQVVNKLVEENISDARLKQIVLQLLNQQDGSSISSAIQTSLDQAVQAFFAGQATQLQQALSELVKHAVPDQEQEKILHELAQSLDLEQLIQNKAAALAAEFVANASYADVVRELGAFGGVLREKIVDLNATLEQSNLLNLLKQGLQAYADLRKKWLNALSDAAHAKLALNFANNVNLIEEDDVMLDLLFHPLSGLSEKDQHAANYLYASLLAGRLDNLVSDLQAAEASVTLLGGALQSKLSRLQQATLDLNLFGLNLSWSSSASAKLNLQGTPRGELIALAGNATAAGTTSTWFGNYQTKLGCEFSYLPMRDGANYQLSFKASFTYAGQNLSPQNLDRTLASLSYVCDLPAQADLLDKLGVASAASAGHAQSLYDLDLILPISLSPQAMIKFTQNQDLPQIATKLTLEMADAYYHNSLHFLHDLPSDLIEQAAAEQSLSNYEFIAGLSGENDLAQILYKLAPDAPTSGSIASNPNLYRALIVRKIARLVNGLVAAQADIAKISDLLRNTQAVSEINQHLLFGVLQKISDDLKPAAVSSETALGNEQTMPWVLSAFALTLASASRLTMPGAFAAIASTKASNGKITTLVLA